MLNHKHENRIFGLVRFGVGEFRERLCVAVAPARAGKSEVQKSKVQSPESEIFNCAWAVHVRPLQTCAGLVRPVANS